MAYEENEHLLEFSNNDDPNWEKNLYNKYGFEEFKPKVFRRVNFDKHTYNVYSDKENFTDIVTDSLICAINGDQIKTSAYKIVNTHSRLPDIMDSKDLKLITEVIEEESTSTAEQESPPPLAEEEAPPTEEQAPPTDNNEEKAEETTSEEVKPDESPESDESPTPAES